MEIFKKMKQGVVIYENEHIVSIVTGFRKPSTNIKTGPMLQQWILVKAFHPTEATHNYTDELICGDCKRRHGTPEERKDTPDEEHSCYVVTGLGPAQVWNAWREGKYDVVENVPIYLEYVADLYSPCSKVRFGSYGDPSMVPDEVLHPWREAARGYTAYTHQWHKRPDLVGKMMASVDSLEERELAKQYGWRTFRVESDHNARPMKDETVCLNARHATITCEACCLCNGKDRDIFIHDHGAYVPVRKRRAA